MALVCLPAEPALDGLERRPVRLFVAGDGRVLARQVARGLGLEQGVEHSEAPLADELVERLVRLRVSAGNQLADKLGRFGCLWVSLVGEALPEQLLVHQVAEQRTKQSRWGCVRVPGRELLDRAHELGHALVLGPETLLREGLSERSLEVSPDDSKQGLVYHVPSVFEFIFWAEFVVRKKF